MSEVPTPEKQRLIVETTKLMLELKRKTPPLIALLEEELRKTEREIAKFKIRRKYGYWIPDFILKLFHSEFTTKGEEDEREE